MNSNFARDFLTIENASRAYLYFHHIFNRNSFIDYESDDLYWTFKNVQSQVCISLQKESQDQLRTKKLVNALTNRRTTEIKLITDLFIEDIPKGSIDFKLRKSKVLCLFNPGNEQTKKNSFYATEALETISDADTISNLLNWIPKDPLSLSKSELEFLLQQEQFTAKAYLSTETPLFILFEVKLTGLHIIELIETNVVNDCFPIEVLKNLIAKFTLSTDVLVVLPQRLHEKLETSIFKDSLKINYYEIKKPQSIQVEICKVPASAVLKRKSHYISAVKRLRSLGVPVHSDLSKNWDSIAALTTILNNKEITVTSPILDAGGEYYSAIIHQLSAFSFSNLYCINTVFEKEQTIGAAKYLPGDVTHTEFNQDTFAAITCLSVIEHGVDLDLFFSETSRILRPNGILFLSTDYWYTPVNTYGKEAYGVKVKIFDQQDIYRLIDIAGEYHLKLMSSFNGSCEHRVVQWDELKYTFVYLTFKKEIDTSI